MKTVGKAPGALSFARQQHFTLSNSKNVNGVAQARPLLPKSHSIIPPRLIKPSFTQKCRPLRHQRLAPQASLTDTAIAVITDTPLRDVLAVSGSIIGAKVLVGIFENLEEMKIIDKV